MSTLGVITARVADMLARSDLNTQIRDEIVLAIKHYERQPWAFTERLDAILTTAAGMAYYTALDATAGEGRDNPGGTTFDRVTAIDYVTHDDDELCPMRFSQIRDLLAGPGNQGDPEWYCLYAGRLVLYPIPSGVFTVTVSGRVKPQIPLIDADGSIWFERAQSLIETRAAGQMAAKFTQDMERAQAFAALEAQQLQALMHESVREQATGRIKAHW